MVRIRGRRPELDQLIDFFYTNHGKTVLAIAISGIAAYSMFAQKLPQSVQKVTSCGFETIILSDQVKIPVLQLNYTDTNLHKCWPESTYVKDLQAILSKYGCYQGTNWGVFDAATEKAVKDMQKNLSIPQTGKFDQKTMTALASYLTNTKKNKFIICSCGYDAIAMSDGSKVPVLTYGMTDAQLQKCWPKTAYIKSLQILMQKFGCYKGSATGGFDSRTQKALKVLQAVLKVPQTGRYDRSTMVAFNNYRNSSKKKYTICNKWTKPGV